MCIVRLEMDFPEARLRGKSTLSSKQKKKIEIAEVDAFFQL